MRKSINIGFLPHGWHFVSYRVVNGKTKATAIELYPQNNGKEYHLSWSYQRVDGAHRPHWPIPLGA